MIEHNLYETIIPVKVNPADKKMYTTAKAVVVYMLEMEYRTWGIMCICPKLVSIDGKSYEDHEIICSAATIEVEKYGTKPISLRWIEIFEGTKKIYLHLDIK